MTEHSDHKERAGTQPEKPPVLVPPDASAPKEEKSSSSAPLLIAGAGLLLVILALLVLFLPLGKEDPPSQAEKLSATSPEQPPPVAQTAAQPNTEAAEEVDQLLGEWLHKQAEAEAGNVAVWGGEAYAASVALAKECDQRLGEQQYLLAQETCAEAIARLEALMTTKGDLFAEALAAGNLALEQGEAKEASDHFQRALTINGDDEQAKNGAHRATELPKVLQLIEEGLVLEKSDDLVGASLAYREASKVDPLFSPAQEALARAEATIANREFQQAMSRALQAFAEGRTAAARKALQQAQTLRPNDPAIEGLRRQISQKQLSDKLSTLRQEAETFETEERWTEALSACEQALALDSHAAFAAGCKARVGPRIDLDNRLKATLSRPERLFGDGPLEEARQLLAYASSLSPLTPRLGKQVEQLTQAVTTAEAETEIVILSDDLTEIAVYHVGRLGHFLEKKLVLRTGDYTATGSRKGFRDVRQTLKVRPGGGRLVFTLRCEEPI